MDGTAFSLDELTTGGAEVPCKVLLLGNYPPRRCGIATFTADVRASLVEAYPDATVDVMAMVDAGGPYEFPEEVVATIDQNDLDDYHRAATFVRDGGYDLVCLQHEFGIFGGPAGMSLLTFLDAVEVPVVATLHTLLTHPDRMQQRVMDGLMARCARFIVMAERGATILRETYGTDPSRIRIVPHGAPDRPLPDTADFKRGFGLAGRKTIFTFGLLSPNKGLEGLIEAMPEVLRACPNARLTILGATHPHLVANEGEKYRESLIAQAEALDVSHAVAFENRFVDTPELLDRLSAADVYVTPYLNETQITSGTLSYAVGLGRPVVSTPYWHAQELLTDGCGVLVPFRDPEAMAREISRLLTDDDHRAAVSAAAYARGRGTIWSELAAAYMDTFATAIAVHGTEGDVLPFARRGEAATHAPRLDAIMPMVDDCGIFQHSVFGMPDRNHGYCVDDNARALMLAVRMAADDMADPALPTLTHCSAAFTHHAWNEDKGAFRNFMGYDRSWLEREGSADSQGRSFQAIAEAGWVATDPALAEWGRTLTERALPHMDGFASPRTNAFVLMGLCAILDAEPAHRAARALAEDLTARLIQRFEDAAREDWVWFEDVLGYDNARLPQAMAMAGRVLENDDALDIAARSFRWLCSIQTAGDGHFHPVGTESFGVPHALPSRFDQQPLEATAQIEAAEAILAATGDTSVVEEATRAWGWFVGQNDLRQPVADPATGRCQDGFSRNEVNRNSGAESLLALQFALVSMHRIAALSGEAGAPSIVAAE